MFKDGARYNGIGPYLKDYFGSRIVKASIDGGFTCPNRDGTLSYAGCYFCSDSGSGDFSGTRVSGDNTDTLKPVHIQMDAQIVSSSKKWHDFRCLAYFQNHTNTYADVSVLREKYETALSHPLCCGIVIATRPDCINDDVLNLLEEISRKTFLWIELGLQTSNDTTAALVNRCCTTKIYDECVERLISRGIRVVTHIIFGLPGESRDDMINTVRHVCNQKIFGVKIHLLHIMKNTVLGDAFTYCHNTSSDNERPKEPIYSTDIIPMSKEDYINTVADALEIIPAEITIHRLTGDAPADLLIEPLWSRDKKSVLNGINMELKRRGTFQGCHSSCERSISDI